MVLEDRVTYRMGTDASGQPNSSRTRRSRSTHLDPDGVFPKTSPVKGEPEKTIAELRQSSSN